MDESFIVANDEEEDDNNDDDATMNMSTYMLEEYSRVTTSLGIVDAYAPDFDLLSDTMRRYAQVEHDGKERQVSNLVASHLVGLSQ
jgi:hypothetical protein